MSIDLCRMELEHPVMIAPGMVKTLADLEAAVNSSASAIVIGSLTGCLDERQGNLEPRSHYEPKRGYMVNAMGLPEPGLQYYWDHESEFLRLLDLARARGKKIILSIALLGDFNESLRHLLHLATTWDVHAVELNLGCPNVWGSGEQKSIPSFDIEGMERQIALVVSLWEGRVGLKVSPYSNPEELKSVAQMIADYTWNPRLGLRDRIYIVTANTFPNAIVMQGGKPYLSTILGGFSGPAYLPIALGQVYQWVEALKLFDSPIPVVGVGGISSGQDVADFLTCGATAVQVAADYWHRSPSTIERIVAEWVALS